MHYVATLTPEDGGYLVTFDDIPEAITQGDDLTDALANAQDALEVALLAHIRDGRELPRSGIKTTNPDQHQVYVHAAVAAKLAFIEAFRESGLTRVAFAAQMGKDEAEVRRWLDPWHQTRLPTLEAALAALGKRLVVDVEEIA